MASPTSFAPLLDARQGVSGTRTSVSSTAVGVSNTDLGVSYTGMVVSNTGIGVSDTDLGVSNPASEPGRGAWRGHRASGVCAEGHVWHLRLPSNPVRPHPVCLSLYILHPTPYTLHPTPYTLHPTPFTLHPTPYTLTVYVNLY